MTKALFWKRWYHPQYRIWVFQTQGFLIDELDDGAFKYVFQSVIVPFPFIEEMGNCGTVTGAVSFKINGLSMIPKRKDGYQYGHDMLDSRLWKEPA